MMHAEGKPGPESFMGKYLWLQNDGPSGVLTVCPHLGELAKRWSETLGRPVDLRLLLQVPGESEALDAMLDYAVDGRGGPIPLIVP